MGLQQLTEDTAGSRWSSEDTPAALASGSSRGSQWISLKLDKMSIVRTITFGKTTKQHPCNTKHFRVYGGLNPDDMVLLQQGVLKNDAQPETLQLNIDVSDHLVRVHKSNDDGLADSYTSFCLVVT